jgi:hypothetical protein
MRLAIRKQDGFKLHRGSARADTAIRPYAEDLDRLAKYGRLTLAVYGRAATPSRGSDCRLASSNTQIVDNPGTKKRRMHCIVVSRLPAVFQRLMLLDYQIELNFASGVEL